MFNPAYWFNKHENTIASVNAIIIKMIHKRMIRITLYSHSSNVLNDIAKEILLNRRLCSFVFINKSTIIFFSIFNWVL